MKRNLVILAILMLFPLLAICQNGEKVTFPKQESDSLRVPKPQAADELSWTKGVQAERAQRINAQKSFLRQVEPNLAPGDTVGDYQFLNRRQYYRKGRYVDAKRAEMSLNKLRGFSARLVNQNGFEGLVLNTNRYKTYHYSIRPLDGGESMYIVLGPNQSKRFFLLPGVYVVTVSDDFESHTEQFRVPKQVNINGVDCAWAVHNPQNYW